MEGRACQCLPRPPPKRLRKNNATILWTDADCETSVHPLVRVSPLQPPYFSAAQCVLHVKKQRIRGRPTADQECMPTQSHEVGAPCRPALNEFRIQSCDIYSSCGSGDRLGWHLLGVPYVFSSMNVLQCWTKDISS